ncbi:MAG: quinohemoprotein amine dehydrogenase maturation protein [Gemmatimonadetes bacterium]|nr:quinohemoprotein amine dehydrogenase maturation protein [Gemmatimonadota bacterium]
MRLLAPGDYHTFTADGAPHVYLLPSAAVFRLDGPSAAVLEAVREAPLDADGLLDRLAPRYTRALVQETIDELLSAQALRTVVPPRAPAPVAAPVAAPAPAPPAPAPPRKRIPLTTLVMNVTSKCNLSCKYCYEYGEDRITEPSSKPRFMSEETARQSVDFMFAEAGDSPHVHLTFFGGETLLNFKVLRAALAYAQEKGAASGKTVDASLTTNATLLRDEIIDWMVEQNVGVTVSMDGAREQQDASRIFANGQGSYDVVLPRVRALLARHTRRPIGARVTLTRDNLDVRSIYRHLKEEIGFWEVGFAPVTTSWQRDYAIPDEGFEEMLAGFQSLARDYLDYALAGRHHGFSNVRDTIQEIHKGVAKAYPCGAGFGLLGVATDGEVGLCHRFAGSSTHSLGTVTGGIDHAMREDFLDKHHIDHKTDCRQCWARSLCAGGCYHEAHTRYGDTARSNLHYCEWIRRWSATCLETYATLAARRPDYLRQFDA